MDLNSLRLLKQKILELADRIAHSSNLLDGEALKYDLVELMTMSFLGHSNFNSIEQISKESVI